jgi:hypothetical protein
VVSAAAVMIGTHLVGAQAAASAPEPEPGVCQGCTPPLIYNNASFGALVMGATGTVTVTPIYWAPSGFSFPTGYASIVNRYVTDIAADSGKTANTYAILPEYYQQTGTAQSKQNIKYQIAAGTAINDTTAYPTGGCTAEPGATVCISQAQVEAELKSVISTNSLTADINHFYVMLFPAGVDQLFGSSHAVGGFCGIHGATQTSAGAPVIYADEPYVVAGCTSGQYPNNNPGADTQVDTLSHEITEAMTDPGPFRTFSNGNFRVSAWYDSSGNEIGDECNGNYGPALGSTDPNNAQASQYNQVVNGDKYYTQTIFSNASYNANIGKGKGCLLAAYTPARTAVTAAAPGAPMTTPSTATLDASPNELPADGSSTSTVTVTELDPNDEPVVGDRIQLDVRHDEDTPSGLCGTVDSDTGVTDAEGRVTATYTASTDDVACFVIAIDAERGASDSALIYQGTSNDLAPRITDAGVPATLTAGGPTETFSVTATNPSTTNDILDARFDLFLSGDNNGAGGGLGLTSSQVHVSYSDPATNGRFVKMPLAGETIDDGEIVGYALPDAAADLAPSGTSTITYKISIDRAPTSAQTGSPLKIEIDLDQLNPADGSQSNLDYVGPAEVPVIARTDTVTWSGSLSDHGHGRGRLTSTSCDLRTQDDPSPDSCTLRATATLTETGGTLDGVITSGDGGSVSFTESFVNTSTTTQTGTGTATLRDHGRSPVPATLTASTTLSPADSPSVVNEQGTIIITEDPPASSPSATATPRYAWQRAPR